MKTTKYLYPTANGYTTVTRRIGLRKKTVKASKKPSLVSRLFPIYALAFTISVGYGINLGALNKEAQAYEFESPAVSSEFIVEAPVLEVINIKTIASSLPPTQVVSTDEIKQYIEYVFGSDADFGLKLAFCESSYNPNAKSNQSSATGIFQFIKSTWIGTRKKMGRDTNLELRTNPKENIDTAYYLFKLNGKRDWKASKGCWN